MAAKPKPKTRQDIPPKLPPGTYCCACGCGITPQESYLNIKDDKYYYKDHAPDYILGADKLLEKYPRDKMLGPNPIQQCYLSKGIVQRIT